MTGGRPRSPAFSEIRDDLLSALATIRAPVYLGYAADDNAEPGRALGAELARLGKVHELVLYPTGGHNFVFNATHPAVEDVFRFLTTHIRR